MKKVRKMVIKNETKMSNTDSNSNLYSDEPWWQRDTQTSKGNPHEPELSFASQDIKDLINNAGRDIVDDNLDSAEQTMQYIGYACYRCHVIHTEN